MIIERFPTRTSQRMVKNLSKVGEAYLLDFDCPSKKGNYYSVEFIYPPRPVNPRVRWWFYTEDNPVVGWHTIRLSAENYGGCATYSSRLQAGWINSEGGQTRLRDLKISPIFYEIGIHCCGVNNLLQSRHGDMGPSLRELANMAYDMAWGSDGSGTNDGFIESHATVPERVGWSDMYTRYEGSDMVKELAAHGDGLA